MIKKLLALIALCFATSAFAAEHYPGATSMTLDTGITVTGGTTLHATTGLWAKRAYFPDATIIAGHTYKFTFTLSSYSAGNVAGYVGGPKTPSTGAWVTTPNGTHGEFDVTDNFNDPATVVSTGAGTPAKETDPNASFRFNCGVPMFRNDDPLLYPGFPGASHLHAFWGNTGVTAYTTYHSLRTSGGTNCGDPAHPAVRAAYWTPAMLDGAGSVMVPVYELTYYKGIPTSLTECQAMPDATHVGLCLPSIPNGLRFIWGCNMASMTGCPPGGSFRFECLDSWGVNNATAPGIYSTIDAVVTAGCPAGKYLYESLDAPQCWDGTHIDSPDHRSHVSVGTGTQIALPDLTAFEPPTIGTKTWGQCPTAFPYVTPSLTLQFLYKTDANFTAGRWHLSSDENMPSAMAAGSTVHFDYWEGWSPYVKAKWETNCINAKNQDSHGGLCDGTAMVGMLQSGNPGAASLIRQPYYPRHRTGWTRNYNANGTYTSEVKALATGELGFYFSGGFVGDISGVSITDVTNVGHRNGAVTVTN